MIRNAIYRKMFFFAFFISLIASIILFSTTAFAATIHVPGDQPTIQAGIDAAVDGDTVLVADGTYTGDGNKNLNLGGKAITVQSENGPQNCIIDCEGDGRGFSSFSQGAIISGFTIMNGYSSRGAAIYGGYNASTINNCILINNTATSLGGAIYSQEDIILTNCIIEGNTAGEGAGLYFHDASPVITNCTIRNNYTSGNVNYNRGGGIYFSYSGSVPIITNCVIADNTAEGFGGGIYLGIYTRPVIINTTISGNTSEKGGGLYCEGDAITVKNSIFWENSPSELFIHVNSTQNVTYCAIKGGYPGETNFHADPLFIDPENGNYQLDPKSACLDAGTGEGAPDMDIQGSPRPQGYGYDLGAYESGFTEDRPIIDSFSVDSDNGMVPFEVTFTCNAHAVATGAVVQQFTMDFGDGSAPITNTTGIFNHLYTDVGVFYANCTVEDSQGNAVISPSIIVHATGTMHVPSEYPKIQDAIDAACEGCTVLIADGTYSGSGNTNLELSGKAVRIESENGPASCIIDCQGNGRGFYIDNGDQSMISGITIANGNESYGGGMEVRYSSPTIKDCIFKDNTARFRGGGIYCWYSSPVIEGCKLINNKTTETISYVCGGGGILFFGSGFATVRNSIFNNNSSICNGGGIYTQRDTQIYNCVFDGNEAISGGGLYSPSSVNVTNCTFYGNRSIGYWKGGAIRADYSSTIVKNCIIWKNVPEEISMTGNTAAVTYCDVYGGHDGEGNFHAEPLFIDAENGDFRLLTNSPGIDAGTSDGAPGSDIEDVERPHGYGFDMGAYEIPYDGQRPIIDSFSADTVEDHVPFDVAFTCMAHDPDGTVTSYTIDYGDGSPVESNTTGVFTHTYNTVGPCSAVCTVTDNDGTSINTLPIDIIRHGNIHVPADYPTIQDAIDAAYNEDTIVLADGIYSGDGNMNLTFSGKAIVVKSENGPANCIIDMENNGRAFMFSSSEGPDTVLSGLTIKNGNSSYGGAIFLRNASPTIQNCILTQNKASADRNREGYGGAIFISGTSSPKIINCLITRNQAVGYFEEGETPEYAYGSAIFCEDEATPDIVNCTIVFNSGDSGAAIYSEETSPFIGNSIIWGNTPVNISTGNSGFLDVQYSDVGGDYPGVANFHGDPVFMDAENDDYRLSISSPCIYAASGDIAPTKDILGVERPVGIRADMGAYEAMGYFDTRPVVDAFTADQNEGETPFQVVFTCQASDVNGHITSYSMTFGDGSTPETNTTGIFTHTYTKGGILFPNCTVTDNSGIEIKSKSITLDVHEIHSVPSQYSTIQAAIDEAIDEDVVQLADGIYTGEGNKDLDFKGKPLTLRSENGPENTIIDCEGEGRGFIFQNKEDSRSIVSGVSIINGNTDRGGAIYCTDATPLITNCFFSNNTAGSGGALHAVSVILENCRIFNNTAGHGGAVYFNAQMWFDRSSSITDCEFELNTAEYYGGAIYISDDGHRPISKCTFYRNSAQTGGGIYTYNGFIDVSRSIFSENSAGSAGAICLGDGSSVVNCIFSKNTANVGGAISNSYANSLIANCTFYKNSATHSGGAMRTFIYYSSDIPEVVNNIFWENTPDQIQADGEYDPDLTFSCVQGGYPGEGNFHGDPVFVDPENLDFHLNTYSPCMYAGTSVNAPEIDFEGNPRPQGYGFDIGAYETNSYDKLRPVVDSFTSDRIEGDLPFDVTFSGIAHDPDGTIMTYTIDYGDGSVPESNQSGNFVHTFTTIGYGDVILTVTDDSGASTNSHSILIKRYGIVQVPDDYSTVQDAIDALLDGNTILVADGVYTGEGNTNINVHGKVLTIQSLNGPENCIIDCQGTGRGFIFENGETEETVISGFTILNGNGDAETSHVFGRNRGGGIYCFMASPTIDNCLIKGNTGTYGGGFYCDESSAVISNCSFIENTAQSGGGLYFRDSAVYVINCLIRKNNATSYGGGIHSSYTDTPTSIVNCIVADNSALMAGGIYSSGSYDTFTITNSTITGNSAENRGGAILSEGNLSLDISNSILWNNMPDEIWKSTYNIFSVQYSDVQGGYEGEGNISEDPNFRNAEKGIYDLTSNSTCVDAGSNDAVDGNYPYDIQGEPRIMDGDLDGIAIVDMGSNEFLWLPDSDEDGLYDIEEETMCTNPDDADTDDDGIFDGIEDDNYNGIVDIGETDPCNADTDGDGIRDKVIDVFGIRIGNTKKYQTGPSILETEVVRADQTTFPVTTYLVEERQEGLTGSSYYEKTTDELRLWGVKDAGSGEFFKFSEGLLVLWDPMKVGDHSSSSATFFRSHYEYNISLTANVVRKESITLIFDTFDAYKIRYVTRVWGYGNSNTVITYEWVVPYLGTVQAQNGGVQIKLTDFSVVSGTITQDSDTDGDGLMDYQEFVFYGTHHNNADTDYDDLTDSEELHYDTDPTDWDSDGDGASDGWEVENGTDPNNPSEYPENLEQPYLIDDLTLSSVAVPYYEEIESSGIEIVETSSEVTDHEAETTIDEDPNSCWSSSGTEMAENEFIIFDLGEIKRLGKIEVFLSDRKHLFPKDLKVSVAEDDSDEAAWCTVVVNDDFSTTEDSVTWEFIPREVQYVKISGQGMWDDSLENYYAEIEEVKFYIRQDDATNSLHLEWTSPEDPEDYRVSEYCIQYKKAGSMEWQDIDDEPMSSMPSETEHYALCGLSSNTEYDVRICSGDSDENWSLWATASGKTMAHDFVDGIILLTPSDEEKIWIGEIPRYGWAGDIYDRYAVQFSNSPTFPNRAIRMPNGSILKTLSHWIRGQEKTFMPTAIQWKNIKRLATEGGEGTLYWRIEGKAGWTIGYSETRHQYDLDAGVLIPQAPAEGEGIDLVISPEFSWIYEGKGIVSFSLEIAVEKDMLGDRREGINFPRFYFKEITGTNYILDDREWKELKKYLSKKYADSFYWRIKGRDTDRVFQIVSPENHVFIDCGSMTPVTPADGETVGTDVPPTLNFTYDGAELSIFQIQLSTVPDFSNSRIAFMNPRLGRILFNGFGYSRALDDSKSWTLDDTTEWARIKKWFKDDPYPWNVYWRVIGTTEDGTFSASSDVSVFGISD